MLSIKEFSKGVFILELEDKDLFGNDSALIKLICPKPFKYIYLDEELKYSEKYFKDFYNSMDRSDVDLDTLSYLFKNVKVSSETNWGSDKLHDVENYYTFIDSSILTEYLKIEKGDIKSINLKGLILYISMDNKGSLKMKSTFQFYGIRHPMLKWYLELYESYIKKQMSNVNILENE